MNTWNKSGIALLLSAAMTQAAASEVEELAKAAGTNIGLVSARLSEHQKNINQIFSKRIALITSVERMAAEGRLEVDREIIVLKQTGGGDLVRLLDALRAHAESAAAAPAQIDAAEAQALQDIMAVYQPLSIPTDNLNSAARKLAALAKEKSDKDRLSFLRSYFKETRDEVEKMEHESAVAEKKGRKDMEDKTASLEAPKRAGAK